PSLKLGTASRTPVLIGSKIGRGRSEYKRSYHPNAALPDPLHQVRAEAVGDLAVVGRVPEHQVGGRAGADRTAPVLETERARAPRGRRVQRLERVEAHLRAGEREHERHAGRGCGAGVEIG